MATMLDAARRYVSRGFSVIPVNPLGHSNPKGPLNNLEHGQYQERRASDAELREWFGNGSNARLGILGGRISGGLVLVDVDDLDLAERIRNDEDFIAGTRRARTASGGLHLYYYCDDTVPNQVYGSDKEGKSQGEVRVEGQYVVAPPSPGYKWEEVGVRIPIIDNWDRWWPDFCLRFDIPEHGSRRRSGKVQPILREGRHSFINRQCVRLYYQGVRKDDLYEALMALDEEKCHPPLGSHEIRRQVLWTERLPDRKQFSLTDAGNANRLVFYYGEDIRYSPGRGWFTWTGKRWLNDSLGQIYQFALETAIGIGEDNSETLQKWSKISQSASKVREMVYLAKSDPSIAIEDSYFDTDPWLLNVANGTLDLRTGKLKEHDRDDLITRQIPIAYEDAIGPTFRTFISRILPDSKVRGFVQRLFGHALTGETGEHVFPIFFGFGANGKSTLTNAVLEVMGDYAKKAAPGMFMTRRDDGELQKMLADLQGTRAVFAAETKEGGRLDEATVKLLIGGERIRARRLYQNAFEFTPTHHTFLSTNHLPEIAGTDDAIWRRVKRVPFSVTIPESEQDKDLAKKLKEEYPYILKWLVAGCSMWQREGLEEPDEIRNFTEEWRRESDLVGRFITDECEYSNSKLTRASILYDQFKLWCARGGERHFTQTRFGRRMRELGFTSGRDSRGQRAWFGVILVRVHSI